MSSKLYAILDMKGSTYGNVFDALCDVDAVRVFDSLVLSPNTTYHNYCEDFALVSICSFNAASGDCSDFRTHVICTAIQRRIEHDASEKFLSSRVDQKVSDLEFAASSDKTDGDLKVDTSSADFEPLGGFLGDF